MSPMNVLYAGLNFTHASSFTAGLNEFAVDRSIVWEWVVNNADGFAEWLEQPRM